MTMSLEAAFYAQLCATSALSALVGTRIYPLGLPHGVTLPAVTFQRVSGPRLRTLGNTNLGGAARFQVSCWGESYADASAVAAAVRTLDNFDGLMGGAGGVTVRAIQQQNEVHLRDPETQWAHVALDFTVWHEGA